MAKISKFYFSVTPKYPEKAMKDFSATANDQTGQAGWSGDFGRQPDDDWSRCDKGYWSAGDNLAWAYGV